MIAKSERYFDRSPTFIPKDREPVNDCFETSNREMMTVGSHALLEALHDALAAREERIYLDRIRQGWCK